MINHSKNIVVKIATISGKDVIIPFCVNAQAFAELVGKKVFSKKHIDLIKSLGYHINVKSEVKTLNHVK